jgi:hypothetical protein
MISVSLYKTNTPSLIRTSGQASGHSHGEEGVIKAMEVETIAGAEDSPLTVGIDLSAKGCVNLEKQLH